MNGEDHAALGADLERLCRRAYPECVSEVRERIAASQFIVAISDGFVKRTLQLEGIASLRAAIERAKAVKCINESSFAERRGGNDNGVSVRANATEVKRRETDTKRGEREGNRVRGPHKKEYWQCGAEGHFRAECPTLKHKEN